MKKTLTLAGLLAAFAVPTATAAPAQPSLHRYQTGKQVKGLQWLLQGHKPSHYSFVTYRGKRNGRYELKTRLAVKRYKYRLGYPVKLLDGNRAGPTFFSIVKGKRARPLTWVAVAAKRAHPTPSPPSGCATRILRAAGGELGVREVPSGSNSGARVSVYQTVTGAYHAAWCVSFAQWVNVQAGLGTLADQTAGVNYAYRWAQTRGWVRATPKPGAWVAFGATHSTHMGIVERVVRTGYFTIEGNHNSGVYRVFRRFGEFQPVYLYQPCLG